MEYDAAGMLVVEDRPPARPDAPGDRQPVRWRPLDDRAPGDLGAVGAALVEPAARAWLHGDRPRVRDERVLGRKPFGRVLGIDPERLGGGHGDGHRLARIRRCGPVGCPCRFGHASSLCRFGDASPISMLGHGTPLSAYWLCITIISHQHTVAG